MINNHFLNFDVNATYGVSNEHYLAVMDKVAGALNPSAIHRGGQKARVLLEEARDNIKSLLGAAAKDDLVFTSGASEANNWVIRSVVGRAMLLGKKPIFVYGMSEHPSIIESIRSYAPVESHLIAIAPTELRDFDCICDDNVVLATFMGANNESGEVFDVSTIFKVVKERAPRAHCHSDLVQCLGKVPIDWALLPIDTASFSGHKIGSFPGVGALLMRGNSNSLDPWQLGGAQELRLRAGTENLPGIVSFGLKALELKEQSIKMADRMAKVMDQLVSKLRQSAPEGLSFNFRDLSRKLPNTLSMRINGIAARDLVVAFDMHGIGISAGAACASGKTDISHVLLAYGFNDKEARETVRVSLTGNESVADIDRFVSALVTIINRIRRVRE